MRTISCRLVGIFRKQKNGLNNNIYITPLFLPRIYLLQYKEDFYFLVVKYTILTPNFLMRVFHNARN